MTKFTIDTRSITRAAKALSSIAPKNAKPEIIGSIVLTVYSSDVVELDATDLRLRTIVRLSALKTDLVPGEKASIAVPAERFHSLLNAADEAETSFNLDSTRWSLEIISGGKKSTIKGYNPEDYPDNPRPPAIGVATKDRPVLPFDTDMLIRIIQEVALAASNVDIFPVLMGINIEIIKNTVTAACTDSYRMAASFNHELPQGTFVPDQSLTLPSAPLSKAAFMLDQLSTTRQVFIQPSEDDVWLQTDNLSFRIVPLVGRYPDFRAALPTSVPTSFEIDTEKLLSAVRYTSVLNSLKLDFDAAASQTVINGEKAHLTISALDPEAGDALEIVPIDLAGEDVHTVFNAALLEQHLSNFLKLGIPRLQVLSQGSQRPFIFRAIGDDSYTVVIMPLSDMTRAMQTENTND